MITELHIFVKSIAVFFMVADLPNFVKVFLKPAAGNCQKGQHYHSIR